MSSKTRRILWAIGLTLITIASFVAVTFRFHLESNVAGLLPDSGDAAALRRYVRGFGGGDLAVVMVKGDDVEENAAVAAEIAKELATKSTVKHAASRVDLSHALDPMLAWRHADGRARQKLAAALTPEGMRERLHDTRAMLLAPGGGSASELLAQDPLRLAQIAFDRGDVAAGMRTQADGSFSTEDGKMCLVLVQAAGQALRSNDAHAFVIDAEQVMHDVGAQHPKVTLGLTGGHAIAWATEVMLTRDFELSGTLSMVLASLVFVAIFRRVRALVAVMPPLIVGTIWTAGLAMILPGGLSAIAVAFMSVVVGVGVDTGVHVYAALLDARRDGHPPKEAAAVARKKTTRAVMWAAITAGLAFGALSLSDINAVRQLGILCGAGEVLTAIAIVVMTPEIGAWLEKGPPPKEAPYGWTRAISWLTDSRFRSAFFAVLAFVPIVAIAVGGAPPLAEALISIRPKKLEPLHVQQEIFDAFGGKKGQWVVLVADRDPEKARVRGDAIAEGLATLKGDVEAVDALTAIVPAPATQRARFAERDALNLPAKAAQLEQALKDEGFAPERFDAVLEGMRHPSHQIVALDDLKEGAAPILLSRYIGKDLGDSLVAIYVRPSDAPGATERIKAKLAELDGAAMLTGYSRLESSLRDSLKHDMPRIGTVAGLLVVIALAMSLKTAVDVILAALVVASEVAIVLLLIRVLNIPLHAYDALVLPVLLGITVDEGMFLLSHARESKHPDVIRDTLRHEGPAIAATALTTAAGFAALGFCDFDGLRDLGWVGALGSTVGLLVALLVVPAGLRLLDPRLRGSKAKPGEAAEVEEPDEAA